MADLLYLDYNCFQRGFDDHRQVRIRMEAEACEQLFNEAEIGRVDLVWSFMHFDENAMCPFADRRDEIVRLASVCKVRIGPEEGIRTGAREIRDRTGLSAKDALHVAAAMHARVDCFVTCDDEIVKKAARLQVAFRVVNPIDYVMGKGREP